MCTTVLAAPTFAALLAANLVLVVNPSDRIPPVDVDLVAPLPDMVPTYHFHKY